MREEKEWVANKWDSGRCWHKLAFGAFITIFQPLLSIMNHIIMQLSVQTQPSNFLRLRSYFSLFGQ